MCYTVLQYALAPFQVLRFLEPSILNLLTILDLPALADCTQHDDGFSRWHPGLRDGGRLALGNTHALRP